MTDAINYAILDAVETLTGAPSVARTMPLDRPLLKIDTFRQAPIDYVWSGTLRSIQPRLFDRRSGQMFSLDTLPNTASEGDTNQTFPRLCVQSEGATTVLHKSATMRPAGQIEYLLPLAESPSDPNPVATQIRMWNPSFDSYYYNTHFANATMRRASTPTVETTFISSAFARPQAPFFSYDKLRKTFVYLSGYYGTTGAVGQPDARNEVYEAYADGSSQVVVGSKGFDGYMAYVADTSRFVKLGPPESIPTWQWTSKNFVPNINLAIFATPFVENATRAFMSANESNRQNNTSSYVSPSLASPLQDGSLSWTPYSAHLISRNATNAKPESAPSSLRTPMWVIEADGGVNIYYVIYEPDIANGTVNPGKEVSATLFSTKYVKGYMFWLIDNNGVELASGYNPAPHFLANWFFANDIVSGMHLGNSLPLSINPVTGLVESIHFVRTAPTMRTSLGYYNELPDYANDSDTRYRNSKVNADIYIGYTRAKVRSA